MGFKGVIICLSVLTFYTGHFLSHGHPLPDKSWSGQEGHVCYTENGAEPNFRDEDCKSYFSCQDYWGTQLYCPTGSQFNFEQSKCMKDTDVWCKWQLEFYGTLGSKGFQDSGTSDSDEERCEGAFGLEPNYQDTECKSYYNCENYKAVLQYCPRGYQYHYDHRECLKDADVLCQWQLDSNEQPRDTSSSRIKSGSGSGSPSSHTHSGSKATSGRRNHEGGLSPLHTPNHKKEGHICKVKDGFEPDFDDTEECSSYWKCDDYWGTLERCESPSQWHFQYGMCMNDDDVSCWVQMEKYYHGHPYDTPSSPSSSSSKESKPETKVCDIAKGQEPNYLDEGCKSYWYCEDHQGTQYECPVGFQFDWTKLDCERDVDVICEKQMEYYYEHIYYRQVHGPDDPFFRPDTREGQRWSGSGGGSSSERDSLSTSSKSDRGGSDRGSEGSDRGSHRCAIEYGRESDPKSKDCQGYWLCSRYQGTYETCPRGYQFHWREKECLKSEYVNCLKQQDSHSVFRQSRPGERRET